MNLNAASAIAATIARSISTPSIVGLARALDSIGNAGDPGVVVDAPSSLGHPPGTLMVVTQHGHAVCIADDVEIRRGRKSPYDTFDEAEDARIAGNFSMFPQKPEHVIADLIEQLEGLGVADWQGAEGLSLEAARAFLESGALGVLIAERAHRAQLAEISWNDADWPFADWQAEVANGDTRRSYAQWVLGNREQALDDDDFIAAVLPTLPSLTDAVTA